MRAHPPAATAAAGVAHRVVLVLRLRAAAEAVWAEQVRLRGALADPSCRPWPRSFTVSARSWLMRRWHHERTVTPTEFGCELRDSVDFEPRIALLGPWIEALQRLRLRRLHRRLRTRHGAPGA